MSRAELEEELSYLRRSLDDLEAERAVGDLTELDYSKLAARYEKRRAEVAQELSSMEPSTESPDSPQERVSRRRFLPRSRRARLATGWSAFSCFVLAALLLSLALAGVAPFSTGPSMSRAERIQIMLAEASELGSSGKVGLALSTYSRVLALDPRQPEALAGAGWLNRLAGLDRHDAARVRTGDAEIEAAVRLAPHYAVARAYAGVVLYRDRGEAKAAVAQFDAFLADHPSRVLVQGVRPEAAAAYKAAGQPLPPSFASAH